MDLSKVSKGGQIFAVGGIVYFISSFLPWFSWNIGGYDVGYDWNGWDTGFLWGGLWALVLIAGAVLIALPAFGVAAPKVPSIAYLAAGGLATLLTVLKLLIGVEWDGDRGFGLYLATLAAICTAFGGFLLFKEGGGSLDDLKDPNKIKASFSAGGGQSAPPPPPPGAGSPPPPPPPPVG